MTKTITITHKCDKCGITDTTITTSPRSLNDINLDYFPLEWRAVVIGRPGPHMDSISYFICGDCRIRTYEFFIVEQDPYGD